MSKTCGNCKFWDADHSCVAPLPRWAIMIINTTLRHFIPAFTDATYCQCWALKDSLKDDKGQCPATAPEGEK